MAKYRMTPKRKAALRKAQLASARKRRHAQRKTRSRRLRAVGGVTVLAATAGAAYAASKYAGRGRNRGRSTGGIRTHPRKVVDVQRIHSMDAKGNMIPPATIGHAMKWLFHGRPARTHVPGVKTPGYVEAQAKARDERAKERKVVKTKKAARRNSKRRRAYWKEKPVPKVNRFTRAAAARKRKKK